VDEPVADGIGNGCVGCPDLERIVRAVQIVQKIATEGRGHDFVVGWSGAVNHAPAKAGGFGIG